MKHVTTFSVYIFISASIACAEVLPTTEQFMNALGACAGQMNLKVDANILGSIRSIYEGQKTDGKVSIQNLPVFLNLFPEVDRKKAYEIYVNCIVKILRPNDRGDAQFCPQSVVDSCRDDARTGSEKAITSCGRVIECESDNQLAYSRISAAYRRLRRWSEAEDAAKKQLQIGQKLDDRSTVANAYYNIAMVYFGKDVYELAEMYAKRSIEFNDRAKSSVADGANYKLLGDIYLKRGDSIAADAYFLRSIDYFKKSSDKRGLAGVYVGYSYSRYSQGDRSAACSYLRMAKSLYDEVGFYEGAGNVERHLQRVKCF